MSLPIRQRLARTVLAPTMAVFYVIDSEGRSVLAAPSVPVILSSHANSSRSVVESRRSFKQKARRKHGQSRVILIRLTRKSHDAKEAFRCEQHGFYYTNDGRCVRPTLRVSNRLLSFAKERQLRINKLRSNNELQRREKRGVVIGGICCYGSQIITQNQAVNSGIRFRP